MTYFFTRISAVPLVEVKELQYKKFEYVRVSSKDQNEERQIENMKYLGIEDRDIFIDKQSGKNMKRENYQMLKRLARTGDTIIFDSLTRLGRSMNDVLEEFRYYEQQRINLQFIKEPFINVNYNGESTNDVIQHAVQKATLTILSAFAEKKKGMISNNDKQKESHSQRSKGKTVRQTAYTNYRTIHRSLRRMARWKHYSGGSDEKI
jgi:DNA invertase Pin-like site-specific DNA recombinase